MSMTRPAILAAACALVAWATCAPSCARGAASSTEAAGGTPTSLTSGKGVTVRFSDKPVALPAFSVQDLDGRALSPADWNGKVVLLNFWATWCGPCREEIPMLIALQEHYRDQLVVVGLSVDERPAADVKQFAKQMGINYPVAIADRALQDAFGGISAVPATFVINPQGGIVMRHLGLVPPATSEQEIRVLASLPSDATTEVVKDTGQVLLANAAYATEIPGVSLAKLTPQQREDALKQLNSEKCTCGCGLTLAQCRINDPTCKISQPAAQKVVDDIARVK
jgi:thiol-disulfide isomerase/thioredoxin